MESMDSNIPENMPGLKDCFVMGKPNLKAQVTAVYTHDHFLSHSLVWDVNPLRLVYF